MRHILLCGLFGLFIFALPLSAAPTQLPLDKPSTEVGQLFVSHDNNSPTLETIAAFGNTLERVNSVDLRGGRYWIHFSFNHEQPEAQWVLKPYGSYMERISVYAFDGTTLQSGHTGQHLPLSHSLHYGVDLNLTAGKTYDIWVLLDSSYFSGAPRIALQEKSDYALYVFKENIFILGCLGAIVILSLYNLLIFIWTRSKEYLYYSLYLISTFTGWAAVFGVFSHLFQWYSVSLIMIPFYLNIITNTLFYQAFLELPKHNPLLSKFGSGVAILCALLAVTMSFYPLWVSYLFINIVNFLWIANGLISGIKRLRAGYKPARFFIAGFSIVSISAGFIILPYFGFPRLIYNEYLVALVSQTLDVMLLALALADRINTLREDKAKALSKAHESDIRANSALKRANDKLLAALKISRESEHKKDEFIMSVSHELRTPLNAISASLDQIKTIHNEQDRYALHNYIQFGVDRLSSQIENILMLAETENYNLKPHEAHFSLRQLINRLEELANNYLFDKSVQFQLIENSRPNSIYVGDQHLLLRLLLPILDNACKYTQEGTVTLHVTEKEGGVVFKIQDSGPGVPQAIQERIFESFTQGSKGYQRSYEGLGLGLTISKRLADILDANISIETSSGTGTCFTVATNMLRAKPNEQYFAPAEQFLTTCVAGHALIVEDNPVNARVLQALLMKIGLTTHTSSNGVEALHSLNDHNFDIIWMDLQMPVMDGFKCAIEMRRRGVTTPIVAVTANTDHKARIRCTDVGMDDFLAKPIKLESLNEMTRKWLTLQTTRTTAFESTAT